MLCWASCIWAQNKIVYLFWQVVLFDPSYVSILIGVWLSRRYTHIRIHARNWSSIALGYCRYFGFHEYTEWDVACICFYPYTSIDSSWQWPLKGYQNMDNALKSCRWWHCTKSLRTKMSNVMWWWCCSQTNCYGIDWGDSDCAHAGDAGSEDRRQCYDYGEE